MLFWVGEKGRRGQNGMRGRQREDGRKVIYGGSGQGRGEEPRSGSYARSKPLSLGRVALIWAATGGSDLRLLKRFFLIFTPARGKWRYLLHFALTATNNPEDKGGRAILHGCSCTGKVFPQGAPSSDSTQACQN